MLFSLSRIVELAVPVHEFPERHTRIYSLDSSNPLKITLLVKQVQYRDLETCKQAMSRELHNQKLRHANIAATHDSDRSTGIVPEEVQAGKSYLYYIYSDLKESFRSLAIRMKQEGSRVPEEDLVSYYQSLIPALAHLQHHGVALRNISPDSIFLSNTDVIKLMDFGYSEVINFQDARPETLAYLSPKLREAAARGSIEVSRFQHDPFKSDVFSVGMAFLHLSLLSFPVVRGNSLREDVHSQLQSLRSLYSGEWYNLVSLMLTYEEPQRPNFIELENKLPLTKIVSSMNNRPKAESNNTRIYVIAGSTNRWNQPVVIKQLTCWNPEDMRRAEEEYKFVRASHHPNICEAIDFLQESSPSGQQFAYLIFPKMIGSLMDDISRRSSMRPDGTEQSQRYTEQELMSYLRQLVDVFAFLQAKNIAHRDIKPDNILIAPDGSLKVCDFGFSKEVIAEGPALTTLLGTYPYISPILRERLINSNILLKHDVFKSDVYSLGMTMLHLTALELPDSLTGLENLRNKLKNYIATCKKDLNEAGIGYSEEWFEYLGLMMRFDEEARPNFLELQRKLTQPLSYYDDEYIEPISVSDTHFSNPLKMKAEFGLSYARVSETTSEVVPCLITLEALPVETSQRINNIDVICLVDESGSMEYERLDITQKVLHFMIDNLIERDRMCIIGFSDNAERRCPLIACSESGKHTLRKIVNRITAKDLTNLVEAFQLALRVVTERRLRNHSVRIVVLSDGKDSCGDDATEACLEVLYANPIEGLTVHCLGIGQETDVEFLQTLASRGNGEYHCIENCDSIPSTFTAAFHEFSRVIARDISISVSLSQSPKVLCKIKQVFSKNETREFIIPEISAQMKKELLYLLETDMQPLSGIIVFPPVKVELRYINHEGTSCHETISKELKFCKWTANSPQQKPLVFQHWIREKANDRLRRARDLSRQNLIEAARQEISNGLEQIESEQMCRDLPLVRNIIEDMQKALDLLRDPSQWNRGGSMKFGSVTYHLESFRYNAE